MTTVAAPMVHDTLPIIGSPSYLAEVDKDKYKDSWKNKLQLPYFRLPGFTKVDRNDIVVFSWPADTVRYFFKKEKGIKKPIDKKSNYVKRCVGIPGDSLEVRNGYVFINGTQLELPGSAKPQYDYMVYSAKGVSSRLLTDIGVQDFTRKYTSGPINQEQAQALQPYLMGFNQLENGQLELYTTTTGIPVDVIRKYRLSTLKEITDRQRLVALTDDMANTLKNNAKIDSVIRQVAPVGRSGGDLFPRE